MRESPPDDEVAAFLAREPVRHNLIMTLLAARDLLANAALFGLEAATDRDRGHFLGISDFPLAVSAARQDAIAAFHAEGFEAAAVTAVDLAAADLPNSSKKLLRVISPARSGSPRCTGHLGWC